MCLSVHLRLSRISYFFFYSACDHRDLHSFPTRRSSDLRASILIDGARLAGARPYAERSEEQPGWHDRAAEFLLAAMLRPLRDRLRDPARRLRRIAELADRHEQRLRSAADADLGALANGMRARLRRDGFAPELVGECFALVRE